MRKFIHFARCMYQNLIDDEIAQRASALAFYAMFSIFPLLLLSVNAISYLLKDPVLVQQITDSFATLFPSGNVLFGQVLQEALKAQGASNLIGLLSLLWGASSFFNGLQGTVNRIFTTQDSRPSWLGRGLGMVMAVVVAALLFAVLLITTAGRLVISYLPAAAAGSGILETIGNRGGIVVVAAFTFALLYHYIPSRRPRLRPTLFGAATATIGWLVASYALLWYVASGLARYNRIYGSIAAVIIFLLWLYVSNFILLLGAEVTAYLSRTKDPNPVPLPAALQRFLEARLGPLEEERLQENPALGSTSPGP